MQSTPTGPLPKIILNEIALEGLEGITIEALWKRLSVALNIPMPLMDSFQQQAWKFILSSHLMLQFFILPTKRENLRIFDRFSLVDIESGIPIVQDEFPYTVYNCFPIQARGIRGSCEFFIERKMISITELQNSSLQGTQEKYGNKLIMVGSQDLRENALIADTASTRIDLTIAQYCLLEYIGRSRYNGETTAGKYSIMTFCKDPTVIFYVRNKLIKCGMVMRQSYTEKYKEKIMFSTLLTLTRFYRENKTLYTILVEKMFNVIKSQPNAIMTMDRFRAELPEKTRASVRKISKTSHFRKIFAVRKIHRKEVEENVEGKLGEHMVNTISLINPDMSVDDLWNDDEIKEDEEEAKTEFCDESHYFLDMPYVEQAYRALDRFGSTGCSATQLMKYMAISKLNIRALVKNLVKLGIVSTYTEDFGRQRTTMYVAIKNSKKNKSIQNAEKTNNILNNLRCNDLPPILPKEDMVNRFAHMPEITDTRKEVIWPREKGNANAVKSFRQVKRKNQIVEIINDQLIISLVDLKNLILKAETKAGYKDQICKKSVVRCVSWLCERKIVRFYEINIKLNDNVRAVRYITHPRIDLYHRLMNDEISKMKHQFSIILEERKYRQISEQNSKNKLSNVIKLKPILKNEIKTPKFLISRFFHELLFYLTYELEADTKQIFVNQDVILQWRELHPHADFANILDDYDLPLYQQNINWKMFVSPLTKSESKPFGWVYLPDVIERLPLSIFVKMFDVDRSSYPKLNEILLHPVRQHFPQRFLPGNLLSLLNRVRLQRTYVNIIKLLQNIGLIQIGQRLYKDPTQLWIYCNRNTRLLDTTISEPNQYYVSEDIDYNETQFHFQTIHDIEGFWNLFHKTCLHTRLGMFGTAQPKRVLRKEMSFLPPVDFESAAELDNGSVPGDSLGAAGVDSTLSSYLSANWSWRVAPLKTQQYLKKGTTLRVKLAKLNQNPVKLLKKQQRSKVTVIAGRRFALKKKRVPKEIKRPKYACDEVDKDALKRMESLRVKWSKEEDDLLKKCRAIYMYIGPQLQEINFLQVAKIARDLLRETLNSLNKTSMACLRRIQFLIRGNRHLPEVPSWLYLLQKSSFINKKYGEKFLILLKQAFKEKTEFEKVLKVHFLFLFGYLEKIINQSSDIINDQSTILPDTLREFYAKYREFCPMSDKEALLHRTPTSEEDVQIETINNLMHSSLCCARDKTMYNIQLFEIYKQYSEGVLSKAFVKARDDQLVVVMKRRMFAEQHTISQMTGPAYTLSNKYRQVLQYMIIPYFVYDKFYENYDHILRNVFALSKAHVEFKSPNSGQLYIIAELMLTKSIVIDLQIPQNILTIDPNAQQFSVSDPERILDHFRQIFDNAPQTEYGKQIDSVENAGNPTKLKFNIANECYKLNYNPYDVITKLNDTYLHFFCTLDSLYRGVSLDFSKLKDDALCPFNCILKASNYVETIDKIIKEKKCIFKDLITDEMVEELNGTAIVVKPENLYAIFNKLKLYLNAYNLNTDKKDLGNIKLKPVNVDIIELCKDLMDYTDEDRSKAYVFEPTLNKEDRFARAQDVFVVNLPTLRIQSAHLEETRVAYKEAFVPEELVSVIKIKESVLQRLTKSSLWDEKIINPESLLAAIRKEGFPKAEEKFILTLLAFLEANPLGVTAKVLMDKYKNELLLVKATKFLQREAWVLRAGVEELTYVHKTHIQPWVISSYHIKRLERESMGDITSTGKRNLPSDDDRNDVVEIKRPKLDEEERNKRLSKPVDRYTAEPVASTSRSVNTPRPKELLTIRPTPWIRVNGSLNRRVLDRWSASILSETMARTGWLIDAVCLKFNQLHPVDVIALLEFLRDIGCVRLKAFTYRKRTIFTEYCETEEYDATEFSAKDKTFVVATARAMSRMTLFIGDKKYSADFI